MRRHYRKTSITESVLAIVLGLAIFITAPTWSAVLGHAIESALAARQGLLQ